MKIASARAGFCLPAIAMLLISMGHAFGQAAGEVNGTVTDKNGGVIAAANVRLTNQDTKVSASTQTNGSGYFVFINVKPGQYSLSVEMAGFKTAQVPSFQLAVNQAVTQNISLDIGSTQETITVSADTPLLQQTSSELGSVISEQAVKELPLNGRNFTQLMILTPGANPISTAQGSTGVGFQDAGVTGIPNTQFYKPSLHGQQNRSVLYYMDGIINTDFRGSIYGVLPIIDAVGEFKVQSHDSKAEVGNVLGGVVNLVSKSGTNEYHGSAWEFVRNNAFDARNPFTDFCNAARCAPGVPSTTPAAPIHYNQNEFGAAVGGPIFKNKTFFYTAYEGWRYDKPSLALTLVPTAAELSGDFSNSYYTNKIYNPFSTVCTNGTCTRSPFPNNVIPGSLISSSTQSYLKAYLLAPNITGITGSNYVEDRPQTDTQNGWQIRLDQNFNERNTMFVRLSQMWVTDIAPVAGTTETTPSTYHAYNFGGGYDHLFSSNLILDVRAGAVLKPYVFNQAQASNGTAPATAAGFQNVAQYGGMVTDLASPYLTSDTGQRGLSQRGNPGINWDAGLTWIKGNHNIKMGAQFIYVNRFQNNLFQQYVFADAQTSNIGAAKTGNSLASELLGLPNTYTGQLPQYASVYFSFQVWGGYIQDEWKVRRNLTITAGLRYDYLPQINPLNGRLSNGFDIPNAKYLIGAKSVGACATPFVDPCIPGGISSVSNNANIVFTGQTSVVPPAVKDNWGPRVGLAWQFTPATVLRAGYGLFYDTVSARSQYAQNDVEGPTWPWTTGIGTQSANIAVGGIWPGATGNPLTSINSLVGSFPNPFVAPNPWTSSGGGYADDPKYKDPRSQQWNVEIQRQFGKGVLLSAAYVGSTNTRLPYTGYANAAPVASPQGTPLAAIDALKYVPFAVPTWHYTQSIGKGNYHGLEMKVQRRWSSGIFTLLSYTWSKSLDNSSGFFNAENGTGGGSVVQNYFTPNLNYGLSGYNVPQLLTWSTVYDLPFGRGQKYLQKGPLSWFLGNWEANYVFLARSGQPYNLVVNGDIANISGNGGTLSGYGRPNIVGNPNSGSCPVNGQTYAVGTYLCYFNPAAFSVPSYAFGTLGKDVFRSPTFFNMDFSLVKTIPLGERRSLQLRFEGFNVFNFQIWAAPGTTIGNSSAGQISSIASTPRELQLAAKFTF